MAESVRVYGPTTLLVGAEGTAYGSLTAMGHAGDEAEFTIESQRSFQVVKSSLLGDEPTEIVYTGEIMLVTGTMTLFDVAQFESLIGTPPGGTTYGDAGVIGTAMVAESSMLTVALDPDRGRSATRPGHHFLRCYVPENGWRLSPISHRAQKAAVSFVCMRQSASGAGEYGDGTSATESIMVKVTS